MTEAVLRRDPAPCLRAVDELYRYGYEVAQFCRDLVRQIRNLTVASLYRDPALLTDLPDDEVQETLRQAALRSPDDLQRLFRIVQAGFEEVREVRAAEARPRDDAPQDGDDAGRRAGGGADRAPRGDGAPPGRRRRAAGRRRDVGRAGRRRVPRRAPRAGASARRVARRRAERGIDAARDARGAASPRDGVRAAMPRLASARGAAASTARAGADAPRSGVTAPRRCVRRAAGRRSSRRRRRR